MLKDIILPGEEFKDLEGFEGYAISDMGRVYSYKRGRILKPQVSNGYGAYPGYEYVRILRGKEYVNVYIHIQVAIAFIPNRYNQREVWHKNGDIKDNTVENLSWSGKGYTDKHFIFGVAEYRCDKSSTSSKGKPVICTTYNFEFESMTEASYVCDLDTRLIRNLCKTGGTYLGLSFKYKVRQIRCKELDMVFDSFEEAAKYVDGKADWVEMCCKGQKKTHKKYHWEYVK